MSRKKHQEKTLDTIVYQHCQFTGTHFFFWKLDTIVYHRSNRDPTLKVTCVHMSLISGWWFGTFLDIFPSIEFLIIPTDELSFFRGVAQTPTSSMVHIGIIFWIMGWHWNKLDSKWMIWGYPQEFRCNNNMEVSWNRGTPKSSREWDFPL